MTEITKLIEDEDFGLIYLCSVRMYLMTGEWKYFKVVEHFAFSAPFTDKFIALVIRDLTEKIFSYVEVWNTGFKRFRYWRVVSHFMRLWLLNHDDFTGVMIGEQYKYFAKSVRESFTSDNLELPTVVDKKMILPLFIYAMDYSHGRQTYMPSVTAKFITRHLDALEDFSDIFALSNKARRIVTKDKQSEDYDPYDHTWDELYRDIRINSYMRDADYDNPSTEVEYFQWIVYEVPHVALSDVYDCQFWMTVMTKLNLQDTQVFKVLQGIYEYKYDEYIDKYYILIDEEKQLYKRKPKEEWGK